MKPEPVPVIKGRHAKEFMKQVEAPSTPEQRSIFNEADKIFRSIKSKESDF